MSSTSLVGSKIQNDKLTALKISQNHKCKKKPTCLIGANYNLFFYHDQYLKDEVKALSQISVISFTLDKIDQSFVLVVCSIKSNKITL